MPVWDEEAGDVAAPEGHRGFLQWARAHGCPWEKRHALGGNLDTLRWERANGCPQDNKPAPMLLVESVWTIFSVQLLTSRLHMPLSIVFGAEPAAS